MHRARICLALSLALLTLLTLGSQSGQVQAGLELLLTRDQSASYPEMRWQFDPRLNGSHILYLTKENFTLTEDGKSITDYQISEEPTDSRQKLAIALVIDTSGSMDGSLYDGAPLNAAKEAAKAFVANIGTRDSLNVYTFAMSIEPLLSKYTIDHDLVSKTIDEIPPANGSTKFADAIYFTVEAMNQLPPEEGRKLIVLLSDAATTAIEGNADQSQHSRQEAIQAAAMAGIPIYAIGLDTIGPVDMVALQEIADGSGGMVFHAQNAVELKQTYTELARGLNSIYVLRYSSSLPADGAYHKFQLAVRYLGSDGSSYDATAGETFFVVRSVFMQWWFWGILGTGAVGIIIGALMVRRTLYVSCAGCRRRIRRSFVRCPYCGASQTPTKGYQQSPLPSTPLQPSSNQPTPPPPSAFSSNARVRGTQPPPDDGDVTQRY